MGIHIDGLRFAYKKNSVLRHVSFDASYGELVCLLGKNGAGKTTLFRCVLGFLNTYHGEIYIDGKNAKTFSPKELARKIAYIPQSHSQIFNYDCLLTVMMGFNTVINAFRGPTEAQEREAYEALRSLGITHLAGKGYAEISGGERQLVLIARALAQRSRILIMDEPTANLDYGNQIRVMKKIKEIARSGYLIIQSTHNPEHALLFADRVIVLRDGELMTNGTPAAVLDAACLESIYGIPVAVHHVVCGSGMAPVCVPDV
jgi:iron complex transport system ATP-binding protein